MKAVPTWLPDSPRLTSSCVERASSLRRSLRRLEAKSRASGSPARISKGGMKILPCTALGRSALEDSLKLSAMAASAAWAALPLA